MAVDLSPGTMVQATNRGNRPFSIQWNGRTHVLKPDQPEYIPAEAAILWFGDPRAVDSAASYRSEGGDVLVIPDRDSEIRRLCVKYGYLKGGEVEFLTKQGEFSDNAVPKVEVRTLDEQKTVLPTVLSDPSGESVTPAAPTVAESNDLRALVERQQRQIEALMKIAGVQPSQVDIPETEELPEDDSHLQGEVTPPDSTKPLDL